jgi:hypothetical protein
MINCSNYWCRTEFKHGNNGLPLYNGRVCDTCNDNVIKERINRLKSGRRF